MVYSSQNYCAFGLFPSSGIIRNRNTTFRMLDLLPSSGEGEKTPTHLAPLERDNLSHWCSFVISIYNTSYEATCTRDIAFHRATIDLFFTMLKRASVTLSVTLYIYRSALPRLVELQKCRIMEVKPCFSHAQGCKNALRECIYTPD
jgi:hypothetical protein